MPSARRSTSIPSAIAAERDSSLGEPLGAAQTASRMRREV